MTEFAHRARSIGNAPPLRYPHSRNIRKGWNSVQLSTPKQVQTQETKQKIYKAASSILKKKGYAYLTVSNICAVAGVSNGTFFYHFKTKDELLVYYNSFFQLMVDSYLQNYEIYVIRAKNILQKLADKG